MTALPDVVERRVLDHIFGGTAMAQYTSFKLALGTSAWTDSEPGTEITTNTGTGNFERQSIAFTAASTSSGVTEVSNNAQITFPSAPSDFGAVQHWAIYGTLGGATELVTHGQFAEVKTLQTGGQLGIAPGGLKVRAD